MMHTEWELLAIAEDIENGDTVAVELSGGEEVPMVFLREKNKNTLELLDMYGNFRYYSTQTLEEHENEEGTGGDSFIIGKSSEKLSAKEILRKRKSRR